MKSSARVVVIGGGVVGASVLYHLTKAGWTDVVLVERKELTAGSTWHAAGGMHTLNGDPNVARLQQYTVNLYKEIEKESGQNCGIHLPGGIQLADTPERLDWLKMAHARGRYLGMKMEIISIKEARNISLALFTTKTKAALTHMVLRTLTQFAQRIVAPRFTRILGSLLSTIALTAHGMSSQTKTTRFTLNMS